MAYHPYFRGKQYELVTIRENASGIAAAGFVPIIEPVREQLGGLKRALDALCKSGAEALVIVNPKFGDHNEDNAELLKLLPNHYGEEQGIIPAYLLTPQTTSAAVLAFCSAHDERPVALVHAGFASAKELTSDKDAIANVSRNIFVEAHAGKLYQKYFEGLGDRVLLRDGFNWRPANRDYPLTEFFSDLHITFVQENMQGFGDFLMVGDRYNESGGPAYAVAIHVTYIDPDNDNGMHIYHFVSDTTDTPSNPAGKFAEAAKKLVKVATAPGTKIFKSAAIAEFVELAESKHFPGLGYVKKLSMQHHIETLANYLAAH